MNLADSLKSACEAIIAVWDRGRIPTQRIDSCIRKLRKLYENYLALKKHSKRQREGDRMKEDMFKDDLEKLFDIAPTDAMEIIKNDEDREFLRRQRLDVFSCSMSAADVNLARKEVRKRQRDDKEFVKG